MITKREIEICSDCTGHGYFVVEELEDYHKGLYRTECKPCQKCEGSGRMVVTTETNTLSVLKTYKAYTERIKS